MKKARWRAQQGLAVQEGVNPDMLAKDLSDKQKANREYVKVMHHVSKKKDD